MLWELFSQEAPRGEKWRKECQISESQWSFFADQMLNYSTNYSAKSEMNLHLLRDRTCRFMIHLGLKIVTFVNISASNYRRKKYIALGMYLLKL